MGYKERPSPAIDLSAEPPPVTAWQIARQLFWLVVVNSPLHDSTIQAWLVWSEEYHPSIDADRFDAHEAFLAAVPVRYWLNNYPPLPWMDLRKGIEATETKRTQEECLPPVPGDAPGLLVAPKSLPKSHTTLQRLATRLDGLIDATDAGLRQQGDQFVTQLATLRSRIAAPLADEPAPFLCSSLAQVLPLWRELEEYLDPTSLGATSWQVLSWTRELERPEYLKGRIRLAKRGDWIATEELRHSQLGLVLNPFRRLRDQILTQLEAKEPSGTVKKEADRERESQGGGGQGKKEGQNAQCQHRSEEQNDSQGV